LYRADEVAAHSLELEVHPPAAGLHVAAGDERAVVAPDDTAQGVQRGVGPHQRVATSPVEIDGQQIVAGRRAVRPRLELMDDVAAGLAGDANRPRPPVRGAKEQAVIRGLPA